MADRVLVDSGIDWIGKIPSNWTVRKIKYSYQIKKTKAHQDDPVILSLARDAIKIRDLSDNFGQLAASYYDYNPVEPLDFLMNPMDLYSGANCNVSKVSGVISPAYINLRATHGDNPFFLDYYMKTQYWSMALFAHGKGISYDNRWTLNPFTLLNYFFPYPSSIDEQNRIVAFLDKQCEAIDNSIKFEERFIDRLLNLKDAIIREAVTKGIKRDSLKETGVDWIGNIPSSWNLLKLKYVSSFICSGATPESGDSSFYNGEVLWIQSGDIDDEITKTEKTLTEAALRKYSALKIVEPPFVVLEMYGGSIGHLGISKIRACTNQACCNMKFDSDYKMRFYSYYFNFVKVKLLSVGEGGTQPNISQDKIKNLFVTVPPQNELEEVVDYLDNKMDLINRAIKVREEKIKKLNTYKRNLIFMYVTGKKEVC